MKKKVKFEFGEKVHEWKDKKEYIILNKTRGDYYIVIDKKGAKWVVPLFMIKKGWRK